MDKKAAEVASFWKNLLKQEWIFIRSTGFRDDRIIINASSSDCSIVLILRKIGSDEYTNHISLGISANSWAEFDKKGMITLTDKLVKLISEKSGVGENLSCKSQQVWGGSERNPERRTYYVIDWHIDPRGYYQQMLKRKEQNSSQINFIFPLFLR